MRRQKGFSLIELLIVVAIILTVQITYISTYPTVGFASTLAALGGTSCSPPTATSSCLIDSQLASGTKSGYTFTLSGVDGTPAGTYQVIASPIAPNQTGVRFFCSFADAVPRASSAPITTCDFTIPPLE